MDKITESKFILAGVALLAAILFPALGWCTGPEAFTAMQWVLGMYFGANVAQGGLSRAPLNASIAEMRDATLRMEAATQHAAAQAELAQSALSSVTYSRSGGPL